MRDLVPSPRPIPDFTPVPRKCKRYDGWTAERQRAFIEALAETGSVKAAAHRINMSFEGAYYLRRQPGAESFAAAWSAALDHGVQQLADIALDRAMHGVPVPVFYKGEQCGEKRWYNDRLLMFLLKHRLIGYDSTPLPRGTRHPDTIAREAAENCPVCRQRREEEEAQAAGAEPTAEEERWLDEVLKRYLAKIHAERQYRRTGQIVAADFTLRQLTYIELILDVGGRGEALIHAWTREPDAHGGRPRFSPARSARGSTRFAGRSGSGPAIRPAPRFRWSAPAPASRCTAAPPTPNATRRATGRRSGWPRRRPSGRRRSARIAGRSGRLAVGGGTRFRVGAGSRTTTRRFDRLILGR